jgi:hypothetical protein
MIYDLKAEEDLRTRVRPEPESPQWARQRRFGFLLRGEYSCETKPIRGDAGWDGARRTGDGAQMRKTNPICPRRTGRRGRGWSQSCETNSISEEVSSVKQEKPMVESSNFTLTTSAGPPAGPVVQTKPISDAGIPHHSTALLFHHSREGADVPGGRGLLYKQSQFRRPSWTGAVLMEVRIGRIGASGFEPPTSWSRTKRSKPN